eukprot:TRINITY_DN56_c0_g1_i1.p1 TRINITY_DN56_c0_g1~~TRINITY_DN56_c0_g1_i1.p1  ORF type:complete len:354 (+),score=67.37 TRINITY_DN56_c0_g1_i1:98-1159(+)
MTSHTGDFGQIRNIASKSHMVGRVESTIDDFNAAFDEKSGATAEERKANYMKIVNQYYDLVTDFYEYGWGQSFHFGPRHKFESLQASLARHEMYLAHRINLQPGMKALDVGCGVGGPARTMAVFSGAEVTGVNNNSYQIQRATKLTADAHLDHLVKFLQTDFMKIPMPDLSYDAIYAIEATCHAPDKVGIYSELYRLLKPGSYFGAYEWVMTDKYDPNNAHHRAIKLGIENGDGLPDLVTGDVVTDALKTCGFEVVDVQDLALTGDIPWYQPLVGSWTSIEGFKSTYAGRYVTDKMVRVLETLRLAPAGSSKVHDMLIVAADSLVEGGKLGIFTPCFFFLARKPLDAAPSHAQ